MFRFAVFISRTSLKIIMQGIIFDWNGTLYEKNKGLFPKTIEILEYLKQNYPLCLITLAKEDNQKRQEILKQTGIIFYFKHIIIDTTKTTQHYQKCMEMMHTSPQNTIIIDDRTQRGIKIGNQLGCQTYWITEGEYAHELPDKETGEPTKRIKNIEELLKCL